MPDALTDSKQTGGGAGLDAAAWVAAFAEGWRAPADADAFADHFESLFDSRARLVQPQTPPIVGHRGFREQFARPLFELMPDLHGSVESWASAVEARAGESSPVDAGSNEVIYIEVCLQGTLGRRRVKLKSVDKVTLRGGVAIERVAHTDTAPLVAAILASPRAWPKFVRAQLRLRRRRLLPGSPRAETQREQRS